MKNITKLMKKEYHRELVQPGKANRETRKEVNNSKRGQRIPESRVHESLKHKQQGRKYLKQELNLIISEY